LKSVGLIGVAGVAFPSLGSCVIAIGGIPAFATFLFLLIFYLAALRALTLFLLPPFLALTFLEPLAYATIPVAYAALIAIPSAIERLNIVGAIPNIAGINGDIKPDANIGIF
jgi:hypothetical protein